MSHDKYHLHAFSDESGTEWFVKVVKGTDAAAFRAMVLENSKGEVDLDIKATTVIEDPDETESHTKAIMALIVLENLKHETIGAVDLFCTHSLGMFLRNAKTITQYNVTGSIMRHGDSDHPNAMPISTLLDGYSNLEAEVLRTGFFGALINATKDLAEQIRGQM